MATAAVLVQGERVECGHGGRLDGAAAVLTLTDRRLMVTDERDWSPLVTWFSLDAAARRAGLGGPARRHHRAVAGGRQVTIDTITDKQPAYELVAQRPAWAADPAILRDVWRHWTIPANGRFGREARLLGSLTHADVAQLVEHHLAKVRVAGSNPVVRSTKPLA